MSFGIRGEGWGGRRTCLGLSVQPPRAGLHGISCFGSWSAWEQLYHCLLQDSERSLIFACWVNSNFMDTNGKIPTGSNGDQHFPPVSEWADQKLKVTHVLKCCIRLGPGASIHVHGACLSIPA